MPVRLCGWRLLRAQPSWQIRTSGGVVHATTKTAKISRHVRSIMTETTGRSPDRPPTAGHILSPEAATISPIPEGKTTEAPQTARQAELKHAKPFSDFLTDAFQRQHDYLRISLTERCNLRCLYCMPEDGVELSPPRNLLTTPEVLLLADIFVGQGVKKIRLTGGEPTVRRDILPLMRQLGDLRRRGLQELCLTTNGLALHRKLDAMVEAGLTGVNLSLDTLDPFQFRLMTRRDGLDAVRRSMDRILALNAAGAGVRLKINCVVMRGLNDGEITDFVALTRDHDLEVRFIEYMPFDGNRWSTGKMVSFKEMLERIRKDYPTLRRTEPDAHYNRPQDTSKTYEVPGFAGRVGFITSMTNNFCGGCNRLRITSDGNLKVCLFGNAEVSLRDIIRRANGDEPIDEACLETLARAAQEAASATGDPDADLPISHVLPNASALLDIIGMAVKRKKERHAGIGELEHMKNRPMILIAFPSSSSSVHKRVAEIGKNTGFTIYADYMHRRLGERNATGLVASWAVRPNTRPAYYPLDVPALFLAEMRLPRTRMYSTEGSGGKGGDPLPQAPRLTHVSASGTAHMVPVGDKEVTVRTAAAACTVHFSNPVAAALVQANEMAKGDVLGVARVAGIMAAKRTSELVPLCHPLMLSHVGVDLEVWPGGAASGDETSGGNSDGQYGHVKISATVRCEGKTGVEMEALTAASVAALTVFDMCKAVDKGMRVDGLRVVFKDGGKSGRWEEKGWGKAGSSGSG